MIYCDSCARKFILPVQVFDTVSLKCEICDKHYERCNFGVMEAPFDMSSEEVVKRLVERMNLWSIDSDERLEPLVLHVLAENQKIVADYIAGNEKAMNALLGKLKVATKGRASSRRLSEIIMKSI